MGVGPGGSSPPPPAVSSSRPPTTSATINSGRGPFPIMTRKHGVHCLLVPTSPHVETYMQALVRVVGPTAIVAASKMYGNVVFFLASEAAAQEAVEKGLAVGGVFVPLEPLENLGVRLILTSVPPFLPNAALLPALSTLGKSISVISPLPLGCKDPTLRHVLSFRWQVQLLPPPAVCDGEALEESFLVPYQEARYWVFYSTGEARRYLCRSAGHVRRYCFLARWGGAPETPETRQDIGSVVANAPGHPVPETTSPPARSTAAPARAQETPPLQRPDERGSPALAVNNPAEPMEEDAAKILPGIGEGPPQGDLPPHAASPLPPQAPEPSPLPPNTTPANQPPDDAMEGWTLVQGKRGKWKARAPLHPSDAEAPRKTRKGGTDTEPSTVPTSEIPPPVSGGEDKIALEEAGVVTLVLAGLARAAACLSLGATMVDLGKVRAKLFCRDYTRGTSRRRNAATEQLEREVLEMERRLATSPKDPFLCGACWEKREELRALEDHRAFVRSRIRLLREMDRGSHFFYALEKTRGAKKHVTCLLAEDGAPLTDPVEMCGRAHDFYTSLFSPDPTDPGACKVLWEELPTVSVGDRDRLELPLTLAEFLEALHRMPTNKSPGMDGLTVEFYRAFWDILGPDLATVWAESLQGGVLPLSCRRAVLALLPKKGDRRDLRNWRPVSLLSTDYKIVAKAISLRLGSVMADVIHPDQTYTVPGRSIFDNLFLVGDLLELGRRDGLSFALLSLDQEKAFDRLDPGYLLGTSQAFGFGPQFVSFLRVLYASAERLARLSWTLTEPVSFGRLTGLVLQKPELWLVLSAYADVVLLVVQDPGDLARVEACQAIYLAAFSARVNWVKSSGLAVGDWRQ
ncbi:unnamed protein product, partial [Caretta caretta]